MINMTEQEMEEPNKIVYVSGRSGEKYHVNPNCRTLSKEPREMDKRTAVYLFGRTKCEWCGND